MTQPARFTVIVPARYASSRFPAKPLADIAGVPMVVRVCERAAQSGAAAVHVATDDERIASTVRGHGYSALMTRADHASGTERIADGLRGHLAHGATMAFVHSQPFSQGGARGLYLFGDRGLDFGLQVHKQFQCPASHPHH